MSNIAPAAGQAMLDWSLLSANPTRPSQLWVGLSSATPTSVLPHEIGVGSGYARQSATFAPADTNHVDYSEAVNLNDLTYGPFSSDQQFIGFHVWNAQIAGQMLRYGSLMQGNALAGGTAKLPASALIVRLG